MTDASWASWYAEAAANCARAVWEVPGWAALRARACALAARDCAKAAHCAKAAQCVAREAGRDGTPGLDPAPAGPSRVARAVHDLSLIHI